MFRFYSAIAYALTATVLIGCTTDLVAVRRLPQETPTKVKYLYSAACECMGHKVEGYLEQNGHRLLLLTEEVLDGTKRKEIPLDSPLTQAGHSTIQHLTNRYINNKFVVQPLSLPVDVAQYLRYGKLLNNEYYKSLMTNHKSNLIVAFSGQFTANDETAGDNGQGATTRYSSEDADVNARIGQKSQGGLLNFVLKIGDPLRNEIIHTVGLQSPVIRDNRTRSFTIGYKNAGVGFSQVRVNVDGLHNVQENMIAAAWFYAWAGLIPGDAELACLGDDTTSPSEVAEWLRDWEGWTKKRQITALQIVVNQYSLKDNLEVIKVDGKLGQSTWDRIREIERRLNLGPHSQGNLDGVYVALLQRLKAMSTEQSSSIDERKSSPQT